mmetsp:Transcript_29613/g.78418  ORF Transcript_29613/g.78418 Transcript_29613/m.78418 type:complete len:568 (-) Transcript_29613:199-1902(-)
MLSHLAVSRHGQAAMMGTEGRSCTRRCTVAPVTVKQTMAFAPTSVARETAAATSASDCSGMCAGSFTLWRLARNIFCSAARRFSRGFSEVSITRLCISTHSALNLPTAVSPLSITASQPSRTAFALSLHSARVGVGHEIMDSNICVATMTGLPYMCPAAIMSFCTKGTSSRFISTPRSPRATITPSDTCRIISRSFTAEGFSTFARILGLLPPASFTRARSSIMSSCFWTKDMAIQSTSALHAKRMSFLSLGVIGDMFRITSGVLTPFLPLSVPPTSTLQSMKGGHLVTSGLGLLSESSRISSLPSHTQPWRITRIRSFPSSRRKVLPGVRANRISGCGSFTRCRLPSSSFMSKRKVWPFSSSTPSAVANMPHRCFGPCMSARMQMGCMYLLSTLRIRSTIAVFSSCSPWEKLSRKTSTPQRKRRSMFSWLPEAGPRVATCLAPLVHLRTVRPSFVSTLSMRFAQGAARSSSEIVPFRSSGTSSQMEHIGPSISTSSSSVVVTAEDFESQSVILRLDWRWRRRALRPCAATPAAQAAAAAAAVLVADMPWTVAVSVAWTAATAFPAR